MADDASPGARSPSVCARYGGRWSIYEHARGWSAHRLGTDGRLRFVTADTEAGLIAAIDAAETGPAAQ